MIMLPLAFRSGKTFLAELDPEHYITDKKRVVPKLTANNLWAKPVESVNASDYLSFTSEEFDEITADFRAMKEWSKSALEKHLAGKHDQSTHGGSKGLPENLPKDVSLTSLSAWVAEKYDIEADRRKWQEGASKVNAIYQNAQDEYNNHQREPMTSGWQEENTRLQTAMYDAEEAKNTYYREAQTESDKAIAEWSAGRFSRDGNDFTFTDRSTADEREARAKWVLDDKKTLQRQRALRAGKEPSEDDLLIDKLVQSGKVLKPTEVYRAAVLKPALADKMVEGFSFTDKAFQAVDLTSSNPLFYVRPGSVRAKAGQTTVLMRSVLRSGTTAMPVGFGEIVLPRNTKVTITNRSVASDGTILLDVDYDTP